MYFCWLIVYFFMLHRDSTLVFSLQIVSNAKFCHVTVTSNPILFHNPIFKYVICGMVALCKRNFR